MSAATNELRRDSYVEKAYVEWERLSWAASDIPCGTDAYRDADDATRAAFRAFLDAQATTPAGFLFKLDVALDFEGYTFDAIDNRNHYAAPAILVSLGKCGEHQPWKLRRFARWWLAISASVASAWSPDRHRAAPARLSPRGRRLTAPVLHCSPSRRAILSE